MHLVIIPKRVCTSPMLGTGHLFYVVILTTRRSSRLQGEGSIFISQVESLSIGPAPRIEPTTFPLQSIVLPTELCIMIIFI